MQSISMGADNHRQTQANMKDNGSQSAPTSPVAKSTPQTPTGHTPAVGNRPSGAAKFFSFRWLFRNNSGGSKTTSSAKKLRLKQINDKTKEKLASIAGAATGSSSSAATNSHRKQPILVRQSYSFDDIQQFFLSQQKLDNNAPVGGHDHLYQPPPPPYDQLNQDNPMVAQAVDNSQESAVGPGVGVGGGGHHRRNKSLCKSSLDIDHKNPKSLLTTKCLTQFRCKLCLTNICGYQMHSIWSCGCAFCKPCLSQYCEMSIREGKVSFITCPDGSCPELDNKSNLISAREIQLLVTKDMYDAYKRYRLNWLIERDPTRTWCPTPNCETVCHIKPPKHHRDSKKPIPVHCSTCNKTFCSSCRRNWHLGIDCKKFNAQEEVLLNESSPIKRCPKCCILIERDEGCAQIMCRNCKHVFCWYCLASLEDDFLLRHYDKGQCKDKLGHSRASVIWHRTQVVGIFAGFGLLILLASPMFILAAPCLLCCRCNSWYKSDADRDAVSTSGADDFDPISAGDLPSAVKSDSIL